MDAAVAPATERLARADHLVGRAVESGAELVLLPELFNLGYGYTDENFRRVETLDGPTVRWMKQTAASRRIHLAGSLLLLDQGQIYNALLLFAPDGRMWRYDKSYPWGWERAYFRGRKGLTVAETDLGAIGLLICWDAAHLNLWRGYAGKVDLMLVSSCPPDVTNPTFIFPNGDTVTFGDFGWVGAQLKDSARRLFGEMVNQQTSWLGVPLVQTVGCGHIRTPLPNSLGSLLSYLPAAPGLVKYLPQGQYIELACNLVQGCKIVNGDGQVLTELEQEAGETFTCAEVSLSSVRPSPLDVQPPSLLPHIGYLVSDGVLPALMQSEYRRGLRLVRTAA